MHGTENGYCSKSDTRSAMSWMPTRYGGGCATSTRRFCRTEPTAATAPLVDLKPRRDFWHHSFVSINSRAFGAIRPVNTVAE